jgi:predicted TIM-barrel fold metal-dependent hydrolase
MTEAGSPARWWFDLTCAARLSREIPMIVDIHAHYFPQEYTDLLMRIGGRTLPEAARPLTARPMRQDAPAGMQTRLQQMDEAGVQMQVLSPAASPPYADREADAVAAARLINDSYAALAQQYPGRLAAFVSLPLPHIDAALREMERGLDQLGMLGVSMTCSCFDRSTAEAEFEPLYEEMNRRGAVLNYHPIQNGICSPMINDYRFTVSVGASLEDSAIVLHLIARRVPTRYPNIKYVVPHLGGIIPMLLQRLDNQAPSQHPDLPEPPSVTARRFYYDTVSHGSQAALLCAWKAFGADHLVAGSDYPVLLAFETYRQTFHYIRECGLPAEDVDKVLNHNAQILLGLAH